MRLGRLRMGQLISHQGMREIPEGKREDHRRKNRENRQVRLFQDNAIREFVFAVLTENEKLQEDRQQDRSQKETGDP